jgi:DedD protein
MAETPPTPEEQALRRRARRRLVGAIALALVAVVVLPLVFDPEPKPMGSNVDVRIPAQNTPFEGVPETPEASPDLAPRNDDVPSPVEAPTVESIPAPEAKTSQSSVKSKQTQAVVSAEKSKGVEPAKPEDKPKASAKLSVVQKPVDSTSKSEVVQEPKDQTYMLQLGSFSSEANAKQQVAKAMMAGFKASAVKIDGQYKVRVGPIPDKIKAQDFQSQLKTKGLVSVLVEP